MDLLRIDRIISVGNLVVETGIHKYIYRIGFLNFNIKGNRGRNQMKKRVLIIVGSLIGVLLIGLIFAGNYFYNQGIKRGTEVELHREDETVNAVSTDEGQILFDEANEWFDDQETEILEMTAYDDLDLVAQYIENDADTDKAVILAHGFRNTSDDVGKLAKLYYDKGFDVLQIGRA